MIEHKNTILAIVLSLLVMVGWQYFIGYPQMERQRQEAQLKQQSQPQGGPTQSATQPGSHSRTRPSPQRRKCRERQEPAHRRSRRKRLHARR